MQDKTEAATIFVSILVLMEVPLHLIGHVRGYQYEVGSILVLMEVLCNAKRERRDIMGEMFQSCFNGSPCTSLKLCI